jgi:hypothetical protein
MKNTFLVIRAVAAEFARRIYVPMLITISIIIVIAIALVIWLVTVSAWWWLLAIPVFLASIVGAVILIIAGIIIRVVNPRQKLEQKVAVKKFVDKLQGLSEIVQTPKIVLLFNVLKDVISPKEEGYVKTTIGNSLSLRKDFETLLRSF